jgi:hypothetical protein
VLFKLKTALKERNEFFVPYFWAEDGLGSFPIGVKSFDCANREIGAPGNRFLPLRMGVLWKAGVFVRLKEKPSDRRSTAVFSVPLE